MTSSKKVFSAIAVVALLAIVAFSPLASADAEKTDIIDGISVDTGDIDSEAVSSLMTKLMEVVKLFDGKGESIKLDGTPDENRDELYKLIKDVAEEIGEDMPDDKIEETANYLALIPTILTSTPYFESYDEINIEKGDILLALDIPNYFVSMLTGDTDPVDLAEIGELGLMMDFHADTKVKATEDFGHMGLFTSGIMTAVSDGLGPLGGVVKNLIVTDNFEAMKSRVVDPIYKDSEYNLRTDTNLSVYLSSITDTNWTPDSTDPSYVNFDLGLHIKGYSEDVLTKISGEGPDEIRSKLDFKNTDIEFTLGFDNVGTGDIPNITLGVKRISMDIGFLSDVDGKVEECTVKNSGVMSIANGIKVTVDNVTEDALKDIKITGFKKGSDNEQTPEMKAVMDAAKESAITEPSYDPSKQYMIGGALAAVGAILILLVAVVKKY